MMLIDCSNSPDTDRAKEVSVLTPNDRLALTPEPLARIYANLSPNEAEEEVCARLEELVMKLSQAEATYRACAFDLLEGTAQRIGELAHGLGMNGLHRVAQDVMACCTTSNNSAALAATVARLARVGDRSTCEIWDMEVTLP